jgi:Transglutaminase-like domain.
MEKQTDTPTKVNKFLEDHIRYASDKAGKFTNYKGQTRDISDDYMQDGIDTYLRGLGDCEDYANIASDYLQNHGYETKIIAFYEKTN